MSFWRRRSVLVTGATGLVGGALLRRLLAADADVVCLVRDWVPQSIAIRESLLERCRIVRGDVCDQELLERTMGEYEVKTVLHLAAQTIVGIANRNPISTLETNIGGTWRLLEACRRSSQVSEIVIASSDKAYGDQTQLPYSENTPLEGRHPYDVSKSCADLIATAYHVTFGSPVAITRCGNFFGPGDLNWNRLVPGTIRSILDNERPVIRSDGKFIRDYFYVEDGARAYMLLAEELAIRPELGGEAFNFSNEVQIDVVGLVERILFLMGSDLEPDIRNEASHEIRHQYLTSEKARRLLGWQAHYTLDAALKETIEWYRSFLSTGSGAS